MKGHVARPTRPAFAIGQIAQPGVNLRYPLQVLFLLGFCTGFLEAATPPVATPLAATAPASTPANQSVSAIQQPPAATQQVAASQQPVVTVSPSPSAPTTAPAPLAYVGTAGSNTPARVDSSASANLEVLKEAIASSNRSVDKISGVFQAYGLWVGILMSLMTIGAGLVSWFAFKSLRDFREEHERRLERAAEEWRGEWDKFKGLATTELEKLIAEAKRHKESAEVSADIAAKHAKEIESGRGILNQALMDLDQVMGKLRAAAPGNGGSQPATAAPPVAPGEAELAADAEAVKTQVRAKLGQPETPPPAA